MDTYTTILFIIVASLPIVGILCLLYKGLEHDYNKQVERINKDKGQGMFLVSDDNLGAHCPHYIVRAVFDSEQDGEWEEDITLVWVKPTSTLDAMYHTLLADVDVYVSSKDNEHDAVSQWLNGKLVDKLLTTEYDDLTLYKSFNLIDI